MLKWIGRFLFIMFVFIATVPVLRYAEYSRLEKFYVETIKGEEDNPDVYLLGISTMFGMDYYQSTPIFSFEGINDYDFTLDIHVFGVTENKDKLNGFMLYLHDVAITDVENPIFKLSVQLDLDTIAEEDGYSNLEEIYINPSNTFAIPMLFLVDSEGNLKVKDEEIYASIEMIEIEFSDGTKDEDGDFIFNDSSLVLISSLPLAQLDQLSFNKFGDLDFTPADYQLREQFADNTPTDAEVIAFDLITDKNDVTSYNWIIWRTIIIYALIVIVIAYFLFFHKKVMDGRRAKSITTSSHEVKNFNSDSIFKDEPIDPKDGK